MASWKKVIVSGSDANLNTLNVQSVTGSLLGTASFAETASYASQSVTASYASNSTSASYALTASYVSGSDVVGTVQSSYTASLALTASYVTYSATTLANVTTVRAVGNISKGQVVRISGANGNNLLVTTASYFSDQYSANVLGVATADIANNALGTVVTDGEISGIDLGAFAAGDLLYLGNLGNLTNVAPVAPLHAVRMGVVEKNVTNGVAYLRVDNGYELNELHDVTYVNRQVGDLLIVSNSVWYNTKQLTGSYGLTGSLDATSFTGSLLGTASYAKTASYVNTLNQAVNINGNLTVTGSTTLSGSAGTTLITAGIDTMILTGSMSITGSFNAAGIFTVTGSVTASGFSGPLAGTASYAETASYANATSTVPFNIGETSTYYGTVNSSTVGLNTVFTLNTGSYTAAKIIYTVYSGSNSRAGEIIASWINGSVKFTDFSTLDNGSTSNVTSSIVVASSQVQLKFQTSTDSWTIKSQGTLI